jgi:hypothetical protein
MRIIQQFFRKIRNFIFNSRGVNAIISSVLLASGVIATGFVVLAYTQQRAMETNIQYADNTSKNIERIQEKLAVEHINYNHTSNELTVFLINCGQSNDLGLVKTYLTNESWVNLFEDIELKLLNDTNTQSLDVSEEGFFKLSIVLTEDTEYTIQIRTMRGRYFVETFSA